MRMVSLKKIAALVGMTADQARRMTERGEAGGFIEMVDRAIKRLTPEEACRITGLPYYGRRKKRPRCGARTRKGTPCKAAGILKGGRCRNHGGMSTGPKTPEGRQRISAAVRERWQRLRAEHNSTAVTE